MEHIQHYNTNRQIQQHSGLHFFKREKSKVREFKKWRSVKWEVESPELGNVF
jgi:hypothetical protein